MNIMNIVFHADGASWSTASPPANGTPLTKLAKSLNKNTIATGANL